jgi:hypothetical protein
VRLGIGWKGSVEWLYFGQVVLACVIGTSSGWRSWEDVFVASVDLDVRAEVAHELCWRPEPVGKIHETDPSVRRDRPRAGGEASQG